MLVFIPYAGQIEHRWGSVHIASYNVGTIKRATQFSLGFLEATYIRQSGDRDALEFQRPTQIAQWWHRFYVYAPSFYFGSISCQ